MIGLGGSHYLGADDGDGPAEEIVGAPADVRPGRNHGEGSLGEIAIEAADREPVENCHMCRVWSHSYC